MSQDRSLFRGLHLYSNNVRHFTHNAWTILVYSLLAGTSSGVFSLLFNFYVLSFGDYDEWFVGELISISSTATVLAALLAVYVGMRFSQKSILIAAGAGNVVAFVGFILLPYRFWLMLFNFVLGLASSTFWMISAPFLMANTSQEERQYVFSFNFGLVAFSGFVGSLLGGWLPTKLGSLVGAPPTSTLAYQLTLGVTALISLLAVGPLVLIRSSASAPVHKGEMAWAQFSQHRRLLLKLITPQLILGLGAALIVPFMNLYYRIVFEADDTTIGILFGVAAIMVSVVQFIVPPLTERLGKIYTMVLTQALSIPFLITLALAAWVGPSESSNYTPWFAAAIVAYLFRAALMNLGAPVYQTFIMEQVPAEVQTLASSLYILSFQVGWVISPYLSGRFLASGITIAEGNSGANFVPVILSTTILYIAATAFIWIFFRGAEKRPQYLPQSSELQSTSIG